MPHKSYVIEFRYPEQTVYAGEFKGALGWAPTLRTALIFDSADDAQRMIRNGYGAQAEYAFVVPLKAQVGA